MDINQNVVKFVADLITEDTDIFNEGIFNWDKTKPEQSKAESDTQPPSVKPQEKFFTTPNVRDRYEFARQIVSQLAQVLPEWSHTLRTTRDGIGLLINALEDWWGKPINSRPGEDSVENAEFKKYIIKLSNEISNRPIQPPRY